MRSLRQWKQLKLNLEYPDTSCARNDSSEDFIASRLSESPTGQIRLMESIGERNNMRRAHLEKSGLRYACAAKDCVICGGDEQATNRVMTKLLEIVFPWI
jgi:hypothetical protein